MVNMAMAKAQGQRDKQAAGAAPPESGQAQASGHSDWEARASSLLILLKRLSGLQRAIQVGSLCAAIDRFSFHHALDKACVQHI